MTSQAILLANFAHNNNNLKDTIGNSYKTVQ